ncbi:MAG: alpha/beta hydrolase [Pedobacter sp.]|nr:MAG: alpha/beta hydrolase [Pedobacter sp.]
MLSIISMKSISKSVACIVLVVMLFAGCDKTETTAYQVEANAKTILDVAYGADAKQKIDVFLPANRTSNTGIIIFIHGGSFIGGDKSELKAQAEYLSTSGYAVINVNYRLVDGTGLLTQINPPRVESAIKIKDQVTDMSTIVDYAIAHAKEWVVNADRIVMVGHSAGGSLALLYSYDKRNSNKVKAVSNLAGALDLVFSDIPNWQFLPKSLFEAGYRYTGYEVALANEQFYKDVSVQYVANADHKIPTLNVFPQNNVLPGLPKQEISVYNKFTARLNELKVPNEFYYVVGSDHFFSQTGKWQLVLTKSLSFFNLTLD